MSPDEPVQLLLVGTDTDIQRWVQRAGARDERTGNETTDGTGAGAIATTTVPDVDRAQARLDGADEWFDGVVLAVGSDSAQEAGARAERLCGAGGRPPVPVLVVADRADEATAAATLSAGATDYLLVDAGRPRPGETDATDGGQQAESGDETDPFGRFERRVHLLLGESAGGTGENGAADGTDTALARTAAAAALDHDQHPTAIDSATDGIALLRDEEYVFMNPAHAAVFGYEPEELLGAEWRQLYDEGQVRRLEEGVFDDLQAAGEWRGRLVGRRKDGSPVHHEVTLSQTDAGEEDFLICTNRDITERVERERELREAKERLDLALEAAGLGVWDWDIRTDEVTFDERCAEMLSYELEELESHYSAWADRVHPDDRAGVEQALEAHLEGETELYETEHRLRTADGDWRRIRDSGCVVERAEDGTPLRAVGVHQDVEEQKRFERTLRQLQSVATTLLETRSPERIGEVGVEAAADLLGLELTGVWQADGPTDCLVPLAVTGKSDELFGDPPAFEPGEGLAWEAFDAGETRVYDDLTAVDERYNEETPVRSEIIVPLGEHGVMVTGSTAERQFSRTDIDLFEILASTVEAALGRAERDQRLERQNEQLDEFASVVAHDLRNPLSIANGFLELAQETGEIEHLARVGTAHDRIDRLVDELLALAHGQTTGDDRERLELSTVVGDAWDYVETGGATLHVGADLPTVAGDPSRLKQLFENLFRNAVEHGPGDGRPPAEATDLTVEVHTLPDREGLAVSDDGVGLPDIPTPELFEYGTTTTGDGTGLGLAIVADVAEAHDWSTEVCESDAGGARFGLRFDD